LVLATLFLVVLFWARDARPPEDTTLAPTRSLVPDEENAFPCFEQARSEIFWPEEKAAEIRQLLDGLSWDVDLAAELIEKNAKAFESLERGLQRPTCQLPESEWFDDRDVSRLRDWMRMAKLTSLKAGALFRHGDEEQAVELCLACVKFGQMLQNSGGDMLDYCAASAVTSMALERVKFFVCHSTLETGLLRAYGDELSSCRSSDDSFAEVLRAECSWKCRSVSVLQNRPMLGAFHCQPNRVKRRIAGVYATLLENVPRYWKDHRTPGKLHFPGRRSLIGLALERNGLGEMLSWVILADTQAIVRALQQRCRENVSLSAIRLLLALKCYEEDNGYLPGTLDELVPRYIAEVPVDSFDGEPMRYSHRSRAVYSVGPNLTDGGGAGFGAPGKRGLRYFADDLVFRIDPDERIGLDSVLPRFKSAWNSGDMAELMDLFHSGSDMRKAYESDGQLREKRGVPLEQMTEAFGEVESWDIGKYIARKGSYVVRVRYAKRGVVPGTFSAHVTDSGEWLLTSFNIDGQAEPELDD